LIFLIRSMECLTAFASSVLPLENFSPSRSLQLYTVLAPSVNWQLSAASGSGSDAPVGKFRRVWWTLRNSSHELSQEAAGSSVLGSLVVPTRIDFPSSEESEEKIPHPATRDMDVIAPI
jgi:hypothetical protein